MTESPALPEILEITLKGNVQIEFRLIPPGSFRMGSRGYNPGEEPVTLVRIEHAFYMGTFPVTQEQYRAMAPVAGLDPEPSWFKGHEDSARRPVEQVSWDDAMEVCGKLSAAGFFKAGLIKNGLDPEKWRAGLPSEVQWEYACRAGSETDYWSGDGEAALAEVGWYGEDWGKGATHPVGELPANRWGLHDMHGNVWEWCADVWDANACRKRVDGWSAAVWRDEDAGKDAEEGWGGYRARLLRGGSWLNAPRSCRSAHRVRNVTGIRTWVEGFRLALVPGPSSQAPASGPEAPEHAERVADGVGPVGGAGGKPRRDAASVPEAADDVSLEDAAFPPLPPAER